MSSLPLDGSKEDVLAWLISSTFTRFAGRSSDARESFVEGERVCFLLAIELDSRLMF